MSRRLPCLRASSSNLVWVVVLIGGLLTGLPHRPAMAADEEIQGLVNLEMGSGSPPVVEPGDDDQPTISGKRHQRYVLATPQPTGGSSSGSNLEIQQEEPAGLKAYVARVRLLVRGWWSVMR